MVCNKPGKSVMLADPTLLEKIDKLFAHGVGEYISLPQLVVVGEQSSGKSSILEGLTKMAFPRDSGLCTRFATQIIFRRDLKTKGRRIVASIVPAPDADEKRAEKLRAWQADDLQSLDSAVFVQMMADVHDLMGLSKKDANDGLPAFSSDVLRLEISGPNEHHLSIIDVPGTFENTTPGFTTDEDKAMINKMVDDYMKNPRSVILPVIPAYADLATQKIDQRAREIDPDGSRTLRILTKPDMVDKGTEQKVVDLVNRGGSKTKFGWFVVRNLNHKELQEKTVERDAAEKEWQAKPPWSSVDKDRWGIEALRLRLQEILSLILRKEFQSVRSEIGGKLNQAKAALHGLGAERETATHQRAYLLDIISKFQTIAQNAKTINYGANYYFDEAQELRLATLIVNRNAEFANDVEKRGHLREFQTDDGSSDPTTTLDSEEERNTISSRKVGPCAELEDILPEPAEVSEPLANITDWLNRVYIDSRGFELGTFSPALLATTMKKQSTKWPTLAEGYISDVITIVHSFVLKTLEYACPNRMVRESLLSRMMDNLLDRYTQALKQVHFLSHIELSGTPITVNHYFADNLQKDRQNRMMKSVESDTFYGSGNKKAVWLSAFTRANHLSNREHTVNEIHDILKSYYKAADFHLLSGPDTPISLFTPSFVNNLTDVELEDIAGEDAAVKRV
ncbi:P-loop containing nucleoside triphosphate hydrolase protein [Aspergillus pseudodeflectus]|uniref:P-loop containing nucleoside triphosphate hydrolase protein n=1 Tax=Aspergillus pseudodeflectus TaxID=176178 RepID=A0ABR4JJB0_9EURO